MMGSVVGFIIELAVVVLLGFTVTYCVILDRRLQSLRTDEKSMRQTVVDLGLATERAERAIDGLRHIISECDSTLGQRLTAAKNTSSDLQDSIKSGDDVLDRIGRIVTSAKRAVSDAETRIQDNSKGAESAKTPSARSESTNSVLDTVAAAEAFALRARRRILDNAA
jgi:chromosome segregation ATPase